MRISFQMNTDEKCLSVKSLQSRVLSPSRGVQANTAPIIKPLLRNSLAVIAAAVFVGSGSTFGQATSAAEKERQLIALIESGAPAAQKATACKELAIYGTGRAVPALAKLLANEQLSSWARIGLEAIPDPAVDKAFRTAIKHLSGRPLEGAIISIGRRGDAKAVSALEKKLKDSSPGIAAAAATALGRIGGSKAAGVLKRGLATENSTTRTAIAEGCILCAEGLALKGKAKDAVRLYEAVRTANVPRQKMLEATRGTILAQGDAGLPLLLDTLRSTDPALSGIALRTARELPGPSATEALIEELDRAALDRQAFLLLAIAERGDAGALPALIRSAQRGSPKLRLTAIQALDRQGDASALPTLLLAATDQSPEISQAALAALARLPGDLTAEILARLERSSGATRQALITVATDRRIEAALPLFLASLKDKDAGVRKAGARGLGELGGEGQIASLVDALPAAEVHGENAEIEAALIAICSRVGAPGARYFTGVLKDGGAGVRSVALHALAACGGVDALAAVVETLKEADEHLRDEAARTLSTWPNNWPEDEAVGQPLLDLARTDRKLSHQVLGQRGYLQYLQASRKLDDAAKATKIRMELLPLLKRPDEKRLAIAALGQLTSAESLEILVAFASDASVTEDACSGILKLAGVDSKALNAEQRRTGLQTVERSSRDEAKRKKAAELLKTLTASL